MNWVHGLHLNNIRGDVYGGITAGVVALPAVLAGILIKVGTDIIDWDYLRRIRHAPKPCVVMMLTVLFLTVFVDLITAVAIGMIMASMVSMKRMTDIQLQGITGITEPSDESPLSEKENALLAETCGRVLLFHLGGPMGFGAAKGMVRRLADFDEYDILLLDFTGVPSVDFTSSLALCDIIEGAQAKHRPFALLGMKPNVLQALKKQNVLRFIQPECLFATRLHALQHVVNVLKDENRPPGCDLGDLHQS